MGAILQTCVLLIILILIVYSNRNIKKTIRNLKLMIERSNTQQKQIDALELVIEELKTRSVKNCSELL